MNKVKAMMKQAYTQSQASVESPVKVNIKPAPEEALFIPIQTTQTPLASVKAAKPTRNELSELPTGVAQIARDDVPVTSYGVKPVATNFNCYNKELFEWLKSFSSNNQFNGGVPITKSQFIEVVLDVIYYDLGINPIGYESQQALREDIQNKIKGI